MRSAVTPNFVPSSQPTAAKGPVAGLGRSCFPPAVLAGMQTGTPTPKMNRNYLVKQECPRYDSVFRFLDEHSETLAHLSQGRHGDLDKHMAGHGEEVGMTQRCSSRKGTRRTVAPGLQLSDPRLTRKGAARSNK